MRKGLRWLAGSSLGFAAAAAAAAAIFLTHPELLLTDWTASTALKRLGSAYAPSWSSLTFSAAAVAPRRHRYALRAADFCAVEPNGAFTGCFKRLEFIAVVSYTRRGPKVEVIENLIALGDSVVVDLRRRAPAPKHHRFPAALRSTLVQAMRVELPDLILHFARSRLEGRFSAKLTRADRRPISIKADFMLRGSRRVKVVFSADTDLFKGGAPTFIDAVGRADIRGGGRALAAFRVRRIRDRYEASGDAEIIASSGPLRSLRLADCLGVVSARSGAARPASGEIACRYELAAAKPPDGPFSALKSAAGGVRLSASVRDSRFTAVLKAELDPIAAWYEISGAAEARLEGGLGRPLRTMKLTHSARAAVKVPRFEDLVELLRETRYAVPAPVHVLKGPLSLSLESRGDPRSDLQSVRYELTTDLEGPRQRLIVRATGQLTAARSRRPRRAFEHEGDLLLKEVALELPRLQIGSSPKVALDRRIRSGDEKAVPSALGDPPSIRSRVSVRTDKPVILFSNLAKEPIPAALDLVATYPPAAVGGVVAVRKFDVELFRRSATIDHLNVALSSGSKIGALEGLVLYKTPSATISILILGTTEKPRVELTSVPPMKREDIIALLIFGKTPNELDPEQSASVSNTQTALESRAFGLASLYLFGATPIEHVGYDSATKTTSVKLRLPGGANLTLGSDFDQNRQLSVRKPLAPHWAIQSEITDEGQQSRAATTFLEWFNRY